MRVISLCADGIKNAADKGFFEWLQQQDADFVCVQDLSCAEQDLYEAPFVLDGYHAYFFDAVSGKSDGVGLYCRTLPKAVLSGLGFDDFDMEGRYIQADYRNLSVGCLLAPRGGDGGGDGGDGSGDPWERRARFLERLKSHLGKVRNKRRDFIICGGWHLTHTDADVQDPGAAGLAGTAAGVAAEIAEQERRWMSEVLEAGYVDAFRVVNSDSDEFTWWPGGDRQGGGLRTDFQLASDGLKPSIDHGAIYKSQVFSSHAPVIMDYDLEPVL